MFCRRCGSEIKPEAKFCGRCGAQVTSASLEPRSPTTVQTAVAARQSAPVVTPLTERTPPELETPVSEVPPEPSQQEPVTTAAESPGPKEEPRSYALLWGILATLAAIAVAGVVYCFGFRGTVPDADIVQNVKGAFFNDANLRKCAIEVTGERGIVTLAGSVNTDADKANAVRIARQQRGVKQVVNQLVEQGSDLPPFAFAGAWVKYRLSCGNQQATITSKVTRVNSSSGNMRIHTSVGVPNSQKLNWDGKASINHPSPNFLAFGTADLAKIKTRNEGHEVGAPPATIEHNVLVSLPKTRVFAEVIHYPDGAAWVDGTSGVIVKIQGTSELSDWCKSVFGWQGKDAPWLELLDSNIPPAVQTHQPSDRTISDVISDASIIENIKVRLLEDANLRDSTLQVTAQDGIVTLVGSVNSDADKASAVRIASQQPGVKQVVDRLVLPGVTLQPDSGSVHASARPAIVEAIIKEGQTSLRLPAGGMYIYGMTTGGARPSGPFFTGRYAEIRDAAGILAAALAYGTNDTNSYTSQAVDHTIGGVSISGQWDSFKAFYGSNSQPGASNASADFLVYEDSLVVVVALASSQWHLSLQGIPDLQVDASAANQGNETQMIIAHAYLRPGIYRISESSSGFGQDAPYMADLIGVFVFGSKR